MGTKTSEIDARCFDTCSLNSHFDVRLLCEWHNGRTLLSAATAKLRKRLFGVSSQFRPAAAYHGLLVFDHEDLNGGGLWYAQDFARAMLHFGIGRCERIFEFCAGPGYIGYNLLASGHCQTLTLADINPRAVEVAQHTALYNGIQDRVNVYRSDVLNDIPESEKWDLVVANPPLLHSEGANSVNMLDYDGNGTLQHRFYATVKKFMNPGGLVLMLYKRGEATPDDFRPMIEAGGGRIVDSLIRKDFRGNESDRYYLLSSW